MIGDKILISSVHYSKAEKILSKIKNGFKIIGVGGCSGTGKTEVALCIQELLYKQNRTSLIVSLDNYYKTMWIDRMRIRKIKGIKSVGTKEIEWTLVKKIIKNYQNKKEIIQLQEVSKFANSLFETTVYNANKIDYLVIEGLYAGYLKKLGLIDYYAHLNGSVKQTKKFRLQRMKDNERSDFRIQIVKKEAKEIIGLKQFADLIVPFSEAKKGGGDRQKEKEKER